MAKVNQNFDNLVPNYLFAEIAKRVNRYVAEHPDNHLIRLGIGDVTLPLAPVVVEAMKKAAMSWAARRPSRAIRIMRAMDSCERQFPAITSGSA